MKGVVQKSFIRIELRVQKAYIVGNYLVFFSGVQCIGIHLLLLFGLFGEYRGSKSKLLLRVTHAIL